MYEGARGAWEGPPCVRCSPYERDADSQHGPSVEEAMVRSLGAACGPNTGI